MMYYQHALCSRTSMLPTADDMAGVKELLARVQNEAKEASAQPAVPTSLAAAVEELSYWLGVYSNDKSLDKTLFGAAGGCQLAADLQHTFCSGSLLARLCSQDAVQHNPAAVTALLRGLDAVVEALPSAAVDHVPIREAAGYIDAAVALAEQHHDNVAGYNSASTVAAAQCQDMRAAFVIVVTRCMQAPGAAERWNVGPSSPALEPLMHLALGVLCTACQVAAEQPNGESGLPTRCTGQAEPAHQLEVQILVNARGQAWSAAGLSRKLLMAALEAAERGRLKLQRLMLCAPHFIKVLDLYAARAGPDKHPHANMHGMGIIGLVVVLMLQQRVLCSLIGPSPSQTHKPLLKWALAQRMQWIEAATALARLLHSTGNAIAAAASSSGNGSGGERGWWEMLPGATLGEAMLALDAVLGLVRDCLGTTSTSFMNSIGALPTFAKLPGAEAATLDLAEMLLRLIPKRPALEGIATRLRSRDDQQASCLLTLQAAAWLAADLAGAPSFQLPSTQLPRGSGQSLWGSESSNDSWGSSSSSSRRRSSSRTVHVEPAERLLQRVASLAGTAAKLVRYLAATPRPLEQSSNESSDAMQTCAFLMEQVAELCGCALALNPQLLETSGPRHRLTQHLQSTGFLAFICLPALAQAHGTMGPQGLKFLLQKQGSMQFIQRLLLRLRALHLVDVAVRGGGLGLLLAHMMRNLLALAEDETMSLLLVIFTLLTDEHTQGLAIALVKDGLLEAAAQLSLRFVRGRRRLYQALKMGRPFWMTVAKPNSFIWVPFPTVLLIRAVCSVLADNASSGLLTAFGALLQDVPPLHRVGFNTEIFASVASTSSGAPPVVIPPETWVPKFSTMKPWEQVCNQLLPAHSAACETLISGSPSQQQDGIFRDVAVSAWTCCDPGCTNMAGQQEASMALSKCAGCGEARYCSRQCQRQDWRRHKPICQVIRELK